MRIILTPGFNFTRRCKALLLTAIFTSSIALNANADELDQTAQFNIPPQALDTALVEFSGQANIQLVVQTDIVNGFATQGVNGEYSARAALSKLLLDTGLTFTPVGADTVAVAKIDGEQEESGKSLPASNNNLVAQAGTSAQQPQTTAGTTRNSGAEETEAGRNIIEEVVVTARKREENLQDVPISISAFSAKDLEARSFTSLRDLGQITPNLSFYDYNQTGSQSGIVYIRGVGQSDPSGFQDPGVGVYMDGVYMGRMQGIDFDLMGVERVEVLRGPQGTLFGKNTIGGAINVVTTKPTDEFSGTAETITGRYNRIDIKANVNVPLVPGKLVAKFAGASRNRDGYGTRLDFLTGEEIDEMGGKNRLSGRAIFYWTPSENVDVLLSLDGTKVREVGPVRKIVAFDQPPNLPGLMGLLNSFVDPDYGDVFLTDSKYTSFATGPNSGDLDSWGAALTVDWDFGSWAVKSITSYRDMKMRTGLDQDGSIYSLIEAAIDINQDQFTQEIQVSGLSLDDQLTWIAGLYYFEEGSLDFQAIDLARDINRDFNGPDFSVTLDRGSDVRNYAAFGQVTYALTDKLGLNAGIRYTYEEKDVRREQFRQYSGLVTVPMASRSDSWDAFSGRVGFQYNWLDNVMSYVSMARGFKSGGINPRSTGDKDFLPYDPEYLWSYEVGLKSTLLDQRLRFNATLFYGDYKDIQSRSSKMDPVTNQLFAIVGNVAKARTKGFEMEIVTVPAQGFTLIAGIGYVDAKYTKADDPFLPITVDSKFIATPEWSTNLSGQFSAPFGNWGDFVGRLDYSYRTKVYHEESNSPLTTQGAYGVLNGRLTFENMGNWSVSVFGTNLANKTYINTGIDYLGRLGFAEVQYARPREWGVSFKYAF